MDQPSLFDYKKEPDAPRPVNLARIRHTLDGNMRKLRRAVTLPWHPVDAEHWEQRFPVLCKLLPEEEGEAILAEFREEMERVWAVYREENARKAAS